MGKRTILLALALLPCFLFTPVKASADIPTEAQPILGQRPKLIQVILQKY